MQVYAVRLFNFFRFGESNNSVVFDILNEDRSLMENGQITVDEIYDKLLKDPVDYVEKIKKQGLTNLIGIAGTIDGNYDLSNGAGKSTILESICYAHYEQIVRRNANTDKVAPAGLSVVTKINGKYPPKMKESWVEEIFEENGKVYRIKRGRTFTSTHRNSSPLTEFTCYNGGIEDSFAGHRKLDSNESIASITPMDYDLFVNSVLFGQSDNGRFLTSTDSVRKEMIISLLKLEDIISKYLENIRGRKKTKEKDIEILSAQIGITENNLKSKNSIDIIELQIQKLYESIKNIDKEIKERNIKIEELSGSEVVKVLENISKEGKKVKDDLGTQKEAKQSRVKEWNELQVRAENKEKEIVNKISNITEKCKQIENQVAKLEKEIKEFDLVSRQEILKKVEKAKTAKPEYMEKVKKLQEQKETIVSDIASESSEHKRLSKENDLLNEQIKTCGDDFICDKCKSKVSRKHIETEIQKNDDLIKNRHGVNINKLQESQKAVVKDLTEVQRRLDIINDYLIKESKVKAEIKENDDKKQKLEDTKKLQTEDYGKMLVDLKTEQQSLISQKNECVAKIKEISDKYDKDINDLQTKLNDLGTQYTNAKKNAETITNTIKTLKDSNEVSSAKKSQHDSQIGSFKKDIENMREEAIKIKEMQEKYTQETLLLKRLVLLEDIYGLEGIQTYIVKKYLSLLNLHIQEIIGVLSDGKMNIKVYINDKSKIDIMIEGGTSDTFVQLSGGEKTLCRLGVSIGLALLSFTRCASKPEMICLDEVFSSLDVSHEELVFKLIKKLKDKFSRIIIISHRASINDRIENKIIVEKGSGINGMSKVRRIT